MQRQLNCPNCGAPIDGHQCKYCGTVIFDFAQIKMGEPCWVALDAGDGTKRLAHVIMRGMDVTQQAVPNIELAEWGNENCNYTFMPHTPETTQVVEFECVPDDKGHLMYMKNEGWSD